MKNTFHLMVRLVLLAILVIPLMANKSCGSALQEAEEGSEDTATAGDVSPEGTVTRGDKVLPVLPEGEEGEDILKSGGPEVKSAPPPSP